MQNGTFVDYSSSNDGTRLQVENERLLQRVMELLALQAKSMDSEVEAAEVGRQERLRLSTAAAGHVPAPERPESDNDVRPLSSGG